MPTQYELARRDLMNMPAALAVAERMVTSASHRQAIRDRIEYRNWLMLTGMTERWNGEIRLKRVLGFDGLTADDWKTLVADVVRLTHVPVARVEEILSKEPGKTQ